jgi:predicted glycosyltransferase
MTAAVKFRLLIYSHDTFGLGHLRRCRAIAHALVDHRADISVLILSGSPIIGSYGFRPRVDFVRFPGIVKLRNGSYTPRGLDISIEDAISIRRGLIWTSAEAFRPHVFLVDKEPLGLRGEVAPALNLLKRQGTRLVLGLRDILDDQEQLAEEWDRKDVMPSLSSLYDDIWIYGSEHIYDPLSGLPVPAEVRAKMRFTGYLRRVVEAEPSAPKPMAEALPGRFVLVTPGGGGDGVEMVEAVLKAAEYQAARPERWGHELLIVLGPFMPAESQMGFKARAARLNGVHVLTFLPDLDAVMRKAAGIVAMGGYNTFCEILSADKPALIIPRTVPRLEQWIRADRMSARGVVRMMSDEAANDPAAMAAAIGALPGGAPPSAAGLGGLLNGFAAINGIVDGWLADAPRLQPRNPGL